MNLLRPPSVSRPWEPTQFPPARVACPPASSSARRSAPSRTGAWSDSSAKATRAPSKRSCDGTAARSAGSPPRSSAAATRTSPRTHSARRSRRCAAATAEIELRPWLYRIVRNTALNDLRDRPPAAAELADDLVAGYRSAAAEAEEREEVAELVEHLRALPENQRAALLMRELDGMGHEEIATTLGISKGAARQAIARGRAAVRSGFGALLPMPLLRSLLDGGAPIEAGVGTGALAGAGATAIGAGGAGALKIGLATVVVAGSLGAGVAIHHDGAGHRHATAPRPAAVDRPPSAPQQPFAVSRDRHGEPRTQSGAEAPRCGGRHTAGDDRSRGRGRRPRPMAIGRRWGGPGGAGDRGPAIDDRSRGGRGARPGGTELMGAPGGRRPRPLDGSPVGQEAPAGRASRLRLVARRFLRSGGRGSSLFGRRFDRADRSLRSVDDDSSGSGGGGGSSGGPGGSEDSEIHP